MMMTAIALLMVAPADPTVRIDAVPGRGYSAVVGTFDSGDFTGVMERVKVIAQQRCG